MSFINAFLGLASAIAGTTVTEAAGVPREAVAFAAPRDGVAMLARSADFGFGTMMGPLAGRALYDAPTGGRLLLVLPFATPRGWGAQPHRLDVGDLRLIFAALRSYPDGDAYSGTIAAGAVAGVCYDVADVAGQTTPDPALATDPMDPGAMYPYQRSGNRFLVRSAPMTAGVGLTITRGVLAAT